MLDDELNKIITKDKTLCSCDNETCYAYGDMYFCYMNNQRRCGLYKEYEDNLMKKIIKKEIK